ncbi:kinesin-8, putative [Plasmodium gallinaceum]|uniref:Kinesin-like protein KIN-8B n=1 Tax=Plasmodium gallinaceum TaxID=5849 RepID=A0A1J1GM12_PLAGA|nr:kinesin-8, putative [Plasmodium gallinaceum]CRG93363.1 kinesin-8, putative [Plasmodium gallinaceum]
MGSINNKKTESYDESKWTQNEINDAGNLKNYDLLPTYNLEEMLISNRTTENENENENEEMTGEFFSSSEFSIKMCDKNAKYMENDNDNLLNKSIKKYNTKDEINEYESQGNFQNEKEDNIYYKEDEDNNDNKIYSNNIENKNIKNDFYKNVENKNEVIETNNEINENMKIFINNIKNNIENEDFTKKCYDEKKLSPLYKNKLENLNESFNGIKEQNFSSVDELMKDIKLFNNSMQSISSTNNMSFHKNLSKMYSGLASSKNLESLNNLYKDSLCNNIDKENSKKCSLQNELKENEEKGISNESIERNSLKNFNTTMNYLSKEFLYDLSKSKCNSNEMDELCEIDIEKKKNIKDNEVNKVKLNINEISPLNLKRSEVNNISSNQWDKMKKSFCDIENNLIDLNKLKLENCEKNIHKTGNEDILIKEKSPNLNYMNSDFSNLNYVNSEFPSLDYTEVDSQKLEIAKNNSPNFNYAKNNSPNLNYAKIDSPNFNYAKIDSPNLNYAKIDSPNLNYLSNDSPKFNFSKNNSLNFNYINNDLQTNLDLAKISTPVLQSTNNKTPNLNFTKIDSPSLNFSKNDLSYLKMPKNELSKIESGKLGGNVKMKSPKSINKICNKAVIGSPKGIKIKSKVNESVKTPKMMKRNSDNNTIKIDNKINANTANNISHTQNITNISNNINAYGKIKQNEKNALGEKDITYNMNVVIRCRPMSVTEKNDGAKNVIKILDNKMVVLLDPSDNSDNVLRQNRSREKKYVFDYAFDENSSQEDVYNNSVKCLIDAVIKGYNSTVFAYGATGAGKTHTIIGYKNEPGIMMMILKDLFEKIKSLEVMNEYKVKCSFIEIYNENICDLLNPSSEYLDLREDPIKGVTVSNIFEVCTTSVEEIMELIHTGNRNRTQEPTDANKTSSRSHGVLQVIVEETEKGQGIYQQTKRGKLCVIDLAGSERASQTNNKGMRMLEGANINRSLLALGNVINALVLRSKGTSKSNFIPFRDSKLTRLLKDSLGGNCKTVMIANISPSHLSYEDTHNTLKYANRAKNIKNIVTSNSIVVKHHLTMYIDVIEKLKNEIEFLKEQLNEKEKMNEYMSTNSTNYDYYDQIKDYDKNYSKEELINIICNLKKENQKLKLCDHNDNNNNNNGNHKLCDDNYNEYSLDDISRYKEEMTNLKLMNEKLFMDNKNFQVKLQEYLQISQNLKSLNEEYKKQIDGFKIMIYNHDINHIQIKKKLDDLKKKYAQLKENTDDKENDDIFEKWKNELTKLLNERKKIKMIILDIERKLIENNEMSLKKISDDDIKILQENKDKLDYQLRNNISQTNNLIKELPIKIKDEKMKNFLYLFYTNKVLLQEKEELQEFFELSSTIIGQKERQIEDLKDQLKMIDVSAISKK